MHMVTVHHAITVCIGRFNHMDGTMRVLVIKKTQLKEDLFFAMKLV
jgi:hypothetical protein